MCGRAAAALRGEAFTSHGFWEEAGRAASVTQQGVAPRVGQRRAAAIRTSTSAGARPPRSRVGPPSCVSWVEGKPSRPREGFLSGARPGGAIRGSSPGVTRCSSSRRKAYKKSEESRRQVLDAAIRVLAKKGVGATSVQDIADGAKLSKGAVHYHFESKDELLERVLDRCSELIETRVRAVFDAGGAPLERIRRALVEMWIMRRDGDDEIRVLSELRILSRQNERIREACRLALQRACRQMIDAALEHILALGLRPKVSVEVVPRLILATLDGLASQQEYDPVTPEFESEALRALEAITMGLFELQPDAVSSS